MPSGKTHDAITFLIAPPTFVAAWALAGSAPTGAIITGAMLFGGLMFGPDLDTASVQYSRWGVFRFLWYPYQAFFPHRSRWSHGLVFGTLFRVVYFMGVLTLTAFLAVYFRAALEGAAAPSLFEISRVWSSIADYASQNIGERAFLSGFIGLWLGAASHTLTDMAGSFIKTGRIMEFL